MKISESKEASRRLEALRATAKQEMGQLEEELSTHIEEKQELVRFLFFKLFSKID